MLFEVRGQRTPAVPLDRIVLGPVGECRVAGGRRPCLSRTRCVATATLAGGRWRVLQGGELVAVARRLGFRWILIQVAYQVEGVNFVTRAEPADLAPDDQARRHRTAVAIFAGMMLARLGRRAQDG